MRLLLIEDDAMFGKALVRGLGQNGMTVDWIRDGSDGLAALTRAEHAAALLDIGLPEMSGYEILKAIRNNVRMPPILIITARDHAENMVTGLDLGADDYLIKPFDLRTLLARIRAVIRRTNVRTSELMTSKDITPEIHPPTSRPSETSKQRCPPVSSRCCML